METEKNAQYVRQINNSNDSITYSNVRSKLFVESIIDEKIDTVCIVRSSLAEYSPFAYSKVKDRIKDEVVAFDVKALREKLTDEEKLLLEYLIAT
ncbi:MAG: hypothetical protein J5993_03155 [Clostridia bacterium]|nr:hypothetical protein [Clostridia bacterium]